MLWHCRCSFRIPAAFPVLSLYSTHPPPEPEQIGCRCLPISSGIQWNLHVCRMFDVQISKLSGGGADGFSGSVTEKNSSTRINMVRNGSSSLVHCQFGNWIQILLQFVVLRKIVLFRRPICIRLLFTETIIWNRKFEFLHEPIHFLLRTTIWHMLFGELRILCRWVSRRGADRTRKFN